MKYANIRCAQFIRRLNRFTAMIEWQGEQHLAHVKNTGRLQELLLPGAVIYVQEHQDPARKTKFSLIAVEQDQQIINIDSQVPNAVAYEALESGRLTLPELRGPYSRIQRERCYGSSRFDLYLETGEQRAFMEVKGVTLKQDGEARFPDAPTTRGIKHIEELIKAKEDAYLAYLLFIVQRQDCPFFAPNIAMHPELAAALQLASANGISLLAYDCLVAQDSIALRQEIPIRLE